MTSKVLVCLAVALSFSLLLPCQRADARRRAAEPDNGPRTAVEVVVKRGESMGLYGRWAKIAMKDLYGRAGLSWGETLSAGRALSIPMTEKEKARFEAARARFAQAREGAFATTAT